MIRLPRAPELLDGALDDPAALAGNLRDLARINRWLGGVRLTLRAVDALPGRMADGGRAVTFLDVGTGGGDMPRAIVADWRRRGRRLEATGVDDRPEILKAAQRLADGRPNEADPLRLVLADGRALPWGDGAFDVVHCSLLLHHLDEPDAVALLREMRRVAAHGVIVNDLERGPFAWLGAWLLGHCCTTNRYTRHDAPLSVRRAYSRTEARALMAVAGLVPVAEFRDRLRTRWAIAACP
jgi:ubiquinone/menaquinone biosynthesis C-methylase UbiE